MHLTPERQCSFTCEKVLKFKMEPSEKWVWFHSFFPTKNVVWLLFLGGPLAIALEILVDGRVQSCQDNIPEKVLKQLTKYLGCPIGNISVTCKVPVDQDSCDITWHNQLAQDTNKYCVNNAGLVWGLRENNLDRILRFFYMVFVMQTSTIVGILLGYVGIYCNQVDSKPGGYL
jgi:hypothetical protein